MYYDYHDGAVMGDVACPQKVPQPELSLHCGTDLPFCEIVHSVFLTFSDFPFLWTNTTKDSCVCSQFQTYL